MTTNINQIEENDDAEIQTNFSAVSEKFKKLFEGALVHISVAVLPTLQALAVTADDQTDELDYAAAKHEEHIQIKIMERKMKFMEKIKAALKRIEKGSFGECQHCGSEISLRRLEARPTASLCVRCQEKLEKHEMNLTPFRLFIPCEGDLAECFA